jgi:cyclase
MVLKRIMPCLLLKEGRLVKTKHFQNPEYIGDPLNAVKIFNSKEVDELVLLDINASKVESNINFELIGDMAAECFMPFSYGGGVKSLSDFQKLFRLGVEKVIVNSLILTNANVIKEAVKNYGSQSIVASIDVEKIGGDYTIYSHTGHTIDSTLEKFISDVLNLGVGELFITSVNKEGSWDGYDDELIDLVTKLVSVPIIINGGCGSKLHLKNILSKENVQAAAVGSMAVYQKKNMGVLIRFPKREEIITDESTF